MIKEFICILCPQGCDISAEIGKNKIISLKGNKCSKGEDYVTQEILNPMRNIATSVLIDNGELPLVSVRLNRMIPKNKVFEVVSKIHELHLKAPISEGDIVIENILGLEADVMITKNIN